MPRTAQISRANTIPGTIRTMAGSRSRIAGDISVVITTTVGVATEKDIRAANVLAQEQTHLQGDLAARGRRATGLARNASVTAIRSRKARQSYNKLLKFALRSVPSGLSSRLRAIDHSEVSSRMDISMRLTVWAGPDVSLAKSTLGKNQNGHARRREKLESLIADRPTMEATISRRVSTDRQKRSIILLKARISIEEAIDCWRINGRAPNDLAKRSMSQSFRSTKAVRYAPPLSMFGFTTGTSFIA